MEAVSKITLEVNGLKVSLIDSVTEPEEELAQQEGTMDGTVQFEVEPNYSPISVDYIIPKNEPEFDWRGVKEGTLTIDRRNGTRITYSGVRTLKLGEIKYDKGKAMRTVELGATGRTES